MSLGFTLASWAAVAVLLAASPLSGSVPDAAFASVPFDQWSAAGPHSGIPWSVDVPPAQLSSHQRLQIVIRVTFNVRDLGRRAAKGPLVAFVEIKDDSGHAVLTHSAVKAANWEQHAFLLPGNYTWSLAVWDAASNAYSFTHRKLHVASLKPDPLPDSWTGLPAIEFIPAASDSPDTWFLPEVTSRMTLPVPTHRPVHLEILLNTTPAGRAAGSVAQLRNNLSVLIPALKVISQLRLENGSMDVSLLDLTHRRVSFEQTSVHELDWQHMKSAFADATPGIVDVATLEGERAGKSQHFFREELSRAMRSAPVGNPNVVLVLNGPAFFEDRDPLPSPDLAGYPGSSVIYVRYRAIPPEVLNPRRRARDGHPLPPPNRPMLSFFLPLDDLERPLASLDANFYDVVSAEQFRRVLAAIMTRLARF